ncbi:MAG: T9SS C-terminal target domain-containing protein [Ignavibacteriales bacterium]|nr:MAG: T9SS C-terminal target domain-containing protein [Ignavibacteriales bacterium]
MLRKITFLLSLLVLLPFILNAQERAVVQPNGKLIKLKSASSLNEALQISKVKTLVSKPNSFTPSLSKTNGMPDTIDHKDIGTWNTNFGIFGQDYLMQWYLASADMKILSVGINCSDGANAIGAEVKLYKLGNGWTEELLKAQNDKNQGYYIAVGNGFLDLAPFADEATGGWVAHTGNPSPFVEDIWSDGGQGAPITPEDDSDNATYQWINMDLLGFQPEIKAGEIFGIVMKNVYQVLDNDNAHRIGNLSSGDAGFDGWKFYAWGRTTGDTATAGWWSRAYTWDMVAAVEITGNTPPDIADVYDLKGTLSTSPIEITATITDNNPGNPANAGVASAFVQYKVNDAADWTDVAMTAGANDVYSGSIPGQEPGSVVVYQVKATDKDGLESTSAFLGSYVVFKPDPNNNTLVVFNGQSAVSGYPQAYYFGVGDFANYDVRLFDHDVWAYGPLSAELVNHYKNIVEICTPQPNDYNDDVILTWLNASSSNNYFLSGQEWLGLRYSYADKDFAAGTFEYDVLGITHSYNDVSYANSTGQNDPSRIFAQQGSPLADSVYAHFTAEGQDSLQYHPYYELGTTYTNWIDAFDVVSGQAVDVLVETRGIGGEVNVQQLPAMTHRIYGTSNKIAFMSFDPLSVNTTDPYHWFGFEKYSFQNLVLDWFGVTSTDVETKTDGIPNKYNLTQNYPNPFNPTTTISFSIPERTNVTLKIFDMLGREVRTLINGSREAGNYNISFEASDFSTGLYVYSLTAGNFTATKKMMLLK